MCKSISFYENNIVNLSLRLSFLRDFTEFLAFLLGFPAFRLAVHSPPIRLFAFFYFYFYWVFPEFRLEVRSLLIHPFTFFLFLVLLGVALSACTGFFFELETFWWAPPAFFY